MAATAGSDAVLARSFGWAMLAVLAAFLLNVILTFWFGFPGAGSMFGEDGASGSSILQVAIYVVFFAAGVGYVLTHTHETLRDDAARIHALNTFLIRAAFWIVVLVGIGDAIVSFMRVEGTLETTFGKDLAVELGRSNLRGIYVHLPLIILGIAIAAFTRSLAFSWLALLVVAAEFLIVITRFVFSYEQAFMADLVRFWYGALFLFASAYTLYDDGHVRVDLFYAGMNNRAKGKVNSVGSVLLGMTLCWTILIIGCQTANSVILGPILVFEVTQSGFGMYVKYFMAGFLGVFAVTMLIQFVVQFFEALADKRGEPGARETHSEMV